jgi:hypothetical protein
MTSVMKVILIYGNQTLRKEPVMPAIRFKAFGDPFVLALAEVAAPAVGQAGIADPPSLSRE